MTHAIKESVTGSVCVDCLFILANGDWPTIGENWTIEQQETAEKGLQQYDWSLGHSHTSDSDTRCWHHGTPCDETPECGDECEQTTFSSSRCDLCNTWLAGSRDDVTIWFNDSTETEK